MRELYLFFQDNIKVVLVNVVSWVFSAITYVRRLLATHAVNEGIVVGHNLMDDIIKGLTIVSLLLAITYTTLKIIDLRFKRKIE